MWEASKSADQLTADINRLNALRTRFVQRYSADNTYREWKQETTTRYDDRITLLSRRLEMVPHKESHIKFCEDTIAEYGIEKQRNTDALNVIQLRRGANPNWGWDVLSVDFEGLQQRRDQKTAQAARSANKNKTRRQRDAERLAIWRANGGSSAQKKKKTNDAKANAADAELARVLMGGGRRSGRGRH